MIRFLGEAIRSYRQTGAIAPSSRRLANSMTQWLACHESPRRILEVGSGTGAFTRRILAGMEDGDRLDAVEINEQFADKIELDLLGPYRLAHPRREVKVHCCPIEEAQLSGPYHMVVCGLPFNNFPLDLVQRIFSIMIDSMAPGGWLTYFEYLGMRPLKAPFIGRRGRSKLRAHGMYLKKLEQEHKGKRKLILPNLPPAWSVALQA